MLGFAPSLTPQLAAERQARFAAEATSSRLHRLLRQPHPAPPCGALAAQLPPAVVDLTGLSATAPEAAATR